MIETSKLARQRLDKLAADMEHTPSLGFELTESRCMAYAEIVQIGRLMSEYGIELMIDVGANTGQYSGTQIGYCDFAGEIIAFEPVPKFYKRLQEVFEYWSEKLKLTAINAAVGEVPGKLEMNIGSGHGGTSSLLDQTDNLATVAPDASFKGDKMFVDVVRIDEYFADADFTSRRTMLKMDVQGFEMSVLRSCGKRLQDFILIQSEFGGIEMYKGQAKPSELFGFMEENGFTPIIMFNNFKCQGTASYYDFDVIFARNDQVVGVGSSVKDKPF